MPSGASLSSLPQRKGRFSSSWSTDWQRGGAIDGIHGPLRLHFCFMTEPVRALWALTAVVAVLAAWAISAKPRDESPTIVMALTTNRFIPAGTSSSRILRKHLSIRTPLPKDQVVEGYLDDISHLGKTRHDLLPGVQFTSRDFQSQVLQH